MVDTATIEGSLTSVTQTHYTVHRHLTHVGGRAGVVRSCMSKVSMAVEKKATASFQDLNSTTLRHNEVAPGHSELLTRA